MAALVRFGLLRHGKRIGGGGGRRRRRRGRKRRRR
jgi:hypothetical protein